MAADRAPRGLRRWLGTMDTVRYGFVRLVAIGGIPGTSGFFVPGFYIHPWRGSLFRPYRHRRRCRVFASPQLFQEAMTTPNYPAPRNAGIARGLPIEHHWPGVRDPGRWARFVTHAFSA